MLLDPIEYRDYFDNIENIIQGLRHEVVTGGYQVRPTKRYLVEKSRGLCRQMTAVHPRDLLALERLARSLYYELLSKAPSKNAYFEPDDGELKKGLDQDDIKYGSYASWLKFQKRVFGFTKDNDYIVTTDIANFFDFISFQHLRNVVAGLADIREAPLDLLIYTLNSLSWTPDYMPSNGIGMPQIETTATRVLANAMLYEVDKVCDTASVSNYARFMDDMTIGTDDLYSARAIVRDLDLSLQTRQIRLNSSKTRLMSNADAHDHYCMEENVWLTKLGKLIDKDAATGRHTGLIGKVALTRYHTWIMSPAGEPEPGGPLSRPNGSKVHKRMFAAIHNNGSRIPSRHLLYLVEHRPEMRGTALKYLSHNRVSVLLLQRICGLLERPTFVDDASLVEITNFLLHARIPFNSSTSRVLARTMKRLSETGDIGLYCAILLSLRFRSESFILRILERNLTRISSDYWLGRAAGVCVVRLRKASSRSRFAEFGRAISSPSFYETYEFVSGLENAASLSQSMSAYLKASNDSFPMKAYFPKVLSLLALRHNTVNPSLWKTLRVHHPQLIADAYYQRLGF